MLSLKQEQKKQSQFIVRAVLLTALVAALLVVFNMQSTAVPTTTPKVSLGLMEGLVGKSGESVQVLISTETQDYTAIVEAIEAAGGTVTHQYKYATGLAAEIPSDAIFSISELNGVIQVQKDEIREINTGSTSSDAAGGIIPRGSDMDTIDSALPQGAAMMLDLDGIETVSLNAADFADAAPATYNVPGVMEAPPIWASGNTGQDSLAVVIDTGIQSDHPLIFPNAIGGVDLSSDVGTAFEGWNLATNHYHGTHVSGIIAGHGGLILPNSHIIVQSYEYYTGQSLPAYDADNKILPLFGNAPDTQLYGIKVFPHTGAGAPNSLIIAAIEHAIDLKVVDGMDVDIINMSLGGGTGFEGRDLESQTVDAATAAGITVVVSAGNDGPASLMIGSPSGSNTAVTVAAVATPLNSRLFWDFNYGLLGIGEVLYTTNENQVIYFSSRGPTSDNRMKPDTMGVGTFVLSSTTPSSVGFVSGTSMSSPSVAGVVSLLNTYGETVGASPADYKEAVVAGSNPVPHYDAYDQGAGLLSAVDAMAALHADGHYGSIQDPLPASYSHASAMPKGTYISPAQMAAGYAIEVEDLAPGHTLDFWTKIRKGNEKFTIDVSDVELGVDPVLFNSFELNVSTAVRTTAGNNDVSYYIYSTNVYGDAQFTIEDRNVTASGDIFGVGTANSPMMPGYMRITIENDWTSYDNLSGKFVISMEQNPGSGQDEFHNGVLNTGDSAGFFAVGHGPDGVELDLSWRNDWTRYSTTDLDMIVAWFDTDGNLFYNYDGATFFSPEKVTIEADNIDSVYVLVDGYETYGVGEPWKLKVRYLGD